MSIESAINNDFSSPLCHRCFAYTRAFRNEKTNFSFHTKPWTSRVNSPSTEYIGPSIEQRSLEMRNICDALRLLGLCALFNCFQVGQHVLYPCTCCLGSGILPRAISLNLPGGCYASCCNVRFSLVAARDKPVDFRLENFDLKTGSRIVRLRLSSNEKSASRAVSILPLLLGHFWSKAKLLLTSN